MKGQRNISEFTKEGRWKLINSIAMSLSHCYQVSETLLRLLVCWNGENLEYLFPEGTLAPGCYEEFQNQLPIFDIDCVLHCTGQISNHSSRKGYFYLGEEGGSNFFFSTFLLDSLNLSLHQAKNRVLSLSEKVVWVFFSNFIIFISVRTTHRFKSYFSLSKIAFFQ